MVSSEVEARAIAEHVLAERIQPLVSEEVVLTRVWEFSTCWVVGYNSRAFVETGSIRHALAGNGPIIINRNTGAVRLGSSASPVEDQLDPE